MKYFVLVLLAVSIVSIVLTFFVPKNPLGRFLKNSCGGLSFCSPSLAVLIARFRWGWPPCLSNTKLRIIF